MNTRTLFATTLAALALLSTGSAFASDTNIDFASSPRSSLSRADVLEAGAQARAHAPVTHGERNVVIAEGGPALSRAQVKAETLEAIRLGAISRRERNAVPTSEQLENIRQAGQSVVAAARVSI